MNWTGSLMSNMICGKVKREAKTEKNSLGFELDIPAKFRMIITRIMCTQRVHQGIQMSQGSANDNVTSRTTDQ